MSALTSGPEGYSHRAIWVIALPMMLSGMATPLVGIVDTAVMGHMDSAAFLAAVAANATIFSVLFMGLNFLRMGTTGVTAQAYGSGDHARITESLVQPLVLASILALALLILQVPLREAALWLLNPGPESTVLARTYFDIRILSAPAVLSNLVIIGWLLGMQNARGPLAIVLTISLTNACLDLWFVIGLKMTVAGVALASLLAEFAGLTVGALFVIIEMRRHKPVWEFAHYRELSRYRGLFRINSNLFLRSVALLLTFAFITAQGARLGDNILAANAVLMNFLYFMAYALDGIAHAAEALTGKAVGERNRYGLEITVRRTLLWSGGLAGLFSLVYLLAGPSIIDLPSDLAEIRETAGLYLPWLIAAPLLSVWCFLYDGVYVGITRAREMRIVMTVSALLIFLPTWYIFREWGNHALWLALMMFMAARGVGMHIWYRYMLTRHMLAS